MNEVSKLRLMSLKINPKSFYRFFKTKTLCNSNENGYFDLLEIVNNKDHLELVVNDPENSSKKRLKLAFFSN